MPPASSIAVALLVANTASASKYSLNAILVVAAVFSFVVITVIESVVATTWYSKRHPEHQDDGLDNRLED